MARLRISNYRQMHYVLYNAELEELKGTCDIISRGSKVSSQSAKAFSAKHRRQFVTVAESQAVLWRRESLATTRHSHRRIRQKQLSISYHNPSQPRSVLVLHILSPRSQLTTRALSMLGWYFPKFICDSEHNMPIFP